MKQTLALFVFIKLIRNFFLKKGKKKNIDYIVHKIK